MGCADRVLVRSVVQAVDSFQQLPHTNDKDAI